MQRKVMWAGLCFLLFLVLIVAVGRVDVAAIGPEGTSIGLSHVNQSAHDLLGENMTFYKITQLLGYATLLLAAGFGAMGLVQWIQRGSLKKVDRSLWILCGLYAVVAALYVFFEKFIVNYRPIVLPDETGPEASFPSTHTMLFFVILGSSAMMAGFYVRELWLRRTLQALCWALVVAGVLLRLTSGVHWLTDILGGVLISSTLLLLFSAMLNKYGRRRRRRSRSSSRSSGRDS